MDNSFKKQNFHIWVNIAIYASKDLFIHTRDRDDKMYRYKKKLHIMHSEGYLTRTPDFWKVGSYKFKATEKFKKEFKEKYCEISKKIRPDFTDEIRERMLNAFNF